MIGLVKAVRAKVSESCCDKPCKKEGCKVSLPSKCHQRVLIDMDHRESPAEKHGKRCDFLFVGEAKGEGWVVPIELKKGKATIEVVPQLQAGAKVAENVVPDDAKVRFLPVAAYGKGSHKHVRNLLKEKINKEKNKIRFRGMREVVRWIKCGKSLAERMGL